MTFAPLRRARPRALFLLSALALLAAAPAAAQPNPAVRWNQALLQAVRNTGFAPMFTARALAIVHTSMFDAWAAYDPVAVGTRLGGTLRRPASEHTLANKERAVSYAAYRALVDLFPTQKTLFDGVMAEMGFDPSDTSTDPATPTGIGNLVSAALLEFRHHDNSNQLGDLAPGPYSDWTGYQPVNTPDQIVDP
ncbi:MAG TPA: haloperoxidase, partial [Vicinamibacteria bacterium]|nr:haloperoxidase [Vicinamibacteria bacterium]